MGLADARDRYVDKIADVYVYHPCKCYCICAPLLVLLSFLSIAAGMMNFNEQDDAWLIFDSDATQTFKAVEDAKDQVAATSNVELAARRLGAKPHMQVPFERLPSFIRETVGGEVMPRRLQPDDDDFGEIYLFYKVEGGNVFSPAPLRQMCELEVVAAKRLLTVGDTTFSGMDTPLRFFYGTESLAAGGVAGSYFERDNSFFTSLISTGCYDVDQSAIDTVLTTIAADIVAYSTSSQYAGYVTASFANAARTNADPMTPITTTKISGATDMLDDLVQDVQDEVGMEYGMFSGGSLIASAFQGDEDRFKAYGPLRIRVYYGDLDESFMVGLDLSLSMISFVIVFCVIWIYTKSLFLAASGMLQIVLSMPISGIFYHGLFQVKYFHFIHVLVVYLVLGIGADDIFVLVDTFVNLEREEAEKNKEWSPERFKSAFKAAYTRTAGAIFNTSFTTAMAFMSSSGSKAMPMRTCGWFAAICIVMNYVFTMTFFPAALSIWHYRFQGKKCCCCCPSWSVREARGQTGSESETPKIGCLERALQNVYVPFMSKKVGPLRPGACGVLLVGLIVAIQGAYFTSQLTPPREPEVWIPDNHMGRDIQKFFPVASYSPDFLQYEIVGMIWGISGLNIDDLDVYYPDDFEGGTEFDSGFDPSTLEAQQAVLDACEALKQKTCSLVGCENGGSGLLMMDAADQEWSCFMEDFHRWLEYQYPLEHQAGAPSTWPTGTDFVSKLYQFRSDASSREASGCCAESRVLPPNYMEDIGFINGQLKYVQIRIRTTLNEDLSYSDGIDVRDMMDDWIDTQVAVQPAGMGSLKYHGNGLFAQYDLSKELLAGFYQSLAIASPVAFVVLLLSTWNIIVSFYAITSVASVVVCVLGFCRSVMDWDLGIGEAIAGVIVLGYSVDYVVHLAHIYCEAGSSHGMETRDERAKYAIQNMGTTIFAGAITTGGSGLIMFFCFFSFFFKMAVLITVTIMFAFFFSLGFMMSLLWTAGPEGKCGDVVHLFCKFGRVTPGEQAAKAQGSKDDPSSWAQIGA